MNKLFISTLLLSLIACTEQPTPKQSANTQPEKPLVTPAAANPLATISKQAVQIWFSGCIQQTADINKIATFAQQHQMQELSAEQKAQSLFEPDTQRVWGTKSVEGGQFYLTAGHNFCSVKVHFADADVINQETKKLVQNVAKLMKMPVQIVKDEAINGNSDLHQTAYALSPPDAPSQLLFTILTNRTNSTGLQASLNLRVVKK